MLTAKRVYHPRKVAIACQGGGSHAAFAAGVLQGLLEQDDYGKSFILSALTGTCGGAVSAGVAWAWLLRPKGTSLGAQSSVELTAEKARAADAVEHLGQVWRDLECQDWGTGILGGAPFDPLRAMGPFEGLDAFNNFVLVGGSRMAPGVETTCKVASETGRQRMRELYARHLPNLVGKSLDNPVLRVGATSVLQGFSEPLVAEQLDAKQIVDMLLASAALPPLFGPFPLNGSYYWDGLFSHNPPVDCLTNLYREKHLEDKFPDEIWVIQVNPTVCRKVPTTMAELVDRRNEVTGNMALQVELYHIDAMNQLLADRKLPKTVRASLKHYGYRHIDLRVVSLDLGDMDLASKLERSRGHIERLMRAGRDRADKFFNRSSLWTCKTEGVHTAALVGSQGEAPQPSTVCRNLACPGLAFCNMRPVLSNGFDFMQHELELPRR